MSGIMTKIEVLRAGGDIAKEEKQLRVDLSSRALDGLAATAIFGGARRSFALIITSL